MEVSQVIVIHKVYTAGLGYSDSLAGEETGLCEPTNQRRPSFQEAELQRSISHRGD